MIFTDVGVETVFPEIATLLLLYNCTLAVQFDKPNELLLKLSNIAVKSKGEAWNTAGDGVWSIVVDIFLALLYEVPVG